MQLDRAQHAERRVILLVDDEPMIRAWGTGVLEEAGYAVIEARDAAEALDTLQAGVEVHLVFTDMQMPGQLDGLQLAHLVTERWPTIRVLICSGRVVPDRQGLPDRRPLPAKAVCGRGDAQSTSRELKVAS